MKVMLIKVNDILGAHKAFSENQSMHSFPRAVREKVSPHQMEEDGLGFETGPVNAYSRNKLEQCSN